MSDLTQNLLSVGWWKQIYLSTPVTIIRHIIAIILLGLGILGIMLAQGAGFQNLFLSIGLLIGAIALAPEISLIVLAGVTLIAFTKTLSVSTAIVLGAIIIAGAILFIWSK